MTINRSLSLLLYQAQYGILKTHTSPPLLKYTTEYLTSIQRLISYINMGLPFEPGFIARGVVFTESSHREREDNCSKSDHVIMQYLNTVQSQNSLQLQGKIAKLDRPC